MSEKLYLKNLHGFRFIAALLVIISHIELFKSRAGIASLWRNPFVFEAGSAGVDFFFVLSGFLITTLLLKENDRAGHIALRKFYMRRILRIWPLYYLVLFVCYFIVPHIQAFAISGYAELIHQDFFGKLAYSILFMPNVALSVFKNIPYAAPLWSVGVEEQFYLFWPLLLFAFPNKLRTIFIFITSFIGLKVLLIILNRFIHFDPANYVVIKDFIVSLRMECMGIGGLGAYLFYSKNWLSNLLTNNKTLLVALLLLPLVFLFAKNLFELHHILFSILFLVIIMNGALNPKTTINLENKLFFNLGNISYGLYLWHSLCIGLVINMLIKTGLVKNSFWAFNMLLYAGTLLVTILISWISYTYYESWFLKRKASFSIIISGTNAKTDPVPELKSEEITVPAKELKTIPEKA